MSLDLANPSPIKTQRYQIRGKLRAALDAMVWDNLPFADAARKAGFTVRAMRLALGRPHVVAYVRAERQVFRANLVDHATHRLVELSEQDTHKAAAVTATMALMNEHNQEDSRATAVRSSPGLVIVIQSAADSHVLPKASIIDGHTNDINGLPDKGI